MKKEIAGKGNPFGPKREKIGGYQMICENEKWFKINHVGRASMMSTCFTEKILNAKWPANNYPYTDIELWRSMKGKTFMPPVPVCLGIKHGIGLVGGGAHDGETCGHYSNNDINGEYLKQITGTDFDFYQGVKNKFVKNG